MNYNDAEEIYNEFVREVGKLQFEIDRLDNEVEKPFEKLDELIYGGEHDFKTLDDLKTLDLFHEYQDNVTLEFVKIVESQGFSVHDKHLCWRVLPFGNDYLPHMYNGELGSLFNILTDDELGFEFGDYYSVYYFDRYLNKVNYTYDDIVNLFLERLSKATYIRNYELPKINRLCEQLRERFRADRLIEDCKKYIYR